MKTLSYVGDKEGLLDYLKNIFVCERCGSWDGELHRAVDEENDELYLWSMCDVCQDDVNNKY